MVWILFAKIHGETDGPTCTNGVRMRFHEPSEVHKQTNTQIIIPWPQCCLGYKYRAITLHSLPSLIVQLYLNFQYISFHYCTNFQKVHFGAKVHLRIHIFVQIWLHNAQHFIRILTHSPFSSLWTISTIRTSNLISKINNFQFIRQFKFILRAVNLPQCKNLSKILLIIYCSRGLRTSAHIYMHSCLFVCENQ